VGVDKIFGMVGLVICDCEWGMMRIGACLLGISIDWAIA
jgi:hypothetical protein